MRRRTCAFPGCNAAAAGGRCQDCHKAFCGVHVGAVEFAGPRRDGARDTQWTRYVCDACAERTDRHVTDVAAHMARDQAARENRGLWWMERRA